MIAISGLLITSYLYLENREYVDKLGEVDTDLNQVLMEISTTKNNLNQLRTIYNHELSQISQQLTNISQTLPSQPAKPSIQATTSDRELMLEEINKEVTRIEQLLEKLRNHSSKIEETTSHGITLTLPGVGQIPTQYTPAFLNDLINLINTITESQRKISSENTEIRETLGELEDSLAKINQLLKKLEETQKTGEEEAETQQETVETEEEGGEGEGHQSYPLLALLETGETGETTIEGDEEEPGEETEPEETTIPGETGEPAPVSPEQPKPVVTPETTITPVNESISRINASLNHLALQTDITLTQLSNTLEKVEELSWSTNTLIQTVPSLVTPLILLGYLTNVLLLLTGITLFSLHHRIRTPLPEETLVPPTPSPTPSRAPSSMLSSSQAATAPSPERVIAPGLFPPLLRSGPPPQYTIQRLKNRIQYLLSKAHEIAAYSPRFWETVRRYTAAYETATTHFETGKITGDAYIRRLHTINQRLESTVRAYTKATQTFLPYRRRY